MNFYVAISSYFEISFLITLFHSWCCMFQRWTHSPLQGVALILQILLCSSTGLKRRIYSNYFSLLTSACNATRELEAIIGHPFQFGGNFYKKDFCNMSSSWLISNFHRLMIIFFNILTTVYRNFWLIADECKDWNYEINRTCETLYKVTEYTLCFILSSKMENSQISCFSYIILRQNRPKLWNTR